MGFNLLNVLGGAVTGFLTGGPVGAAIGGVAGGVESATQPGGAGQSAFPLAALPSMPDLVSLSVPQASASAQAATGPANAQPPAESFAGLGGDDGDGDG